MLIDTTDGHLSLPLLDFGKMEFPLNLTVTRVRFVLVGLIRASVGWEK